MKATYEKLKCIVRFILKLLHCLCSMKEEEKKEEKKDEETNDLWLVISD